MVQKEAVALSERNHPEAVIIGAAIADILLRPVSAEVFTQGSYPVDSIRMSIGGDAINEATVLARLGHRPLLVTRLGDDGVADTIEAHCRREGICLHSRREPGFDTGINVVLVTGDGERSFITNKNGSLRKLGLAHILPALDTEAYKSARLVCLASMFVSPLLTLEDTETLFARVRADGKILCADTTRRKNGETLADITPAIRHLDYFFPNFEEARLLTGCEAPDGVADAFLSAGVKNVVLKLGGRGCLVKNAAERIEMPVYPDANCIDTTGAGDTFAASFIAALLEGRSLPECAAYANAVASICVEHLGATTGKPEKDEIRRRYKVILERGF